MSLTRILNKLAERISNFAISGKKTGWVKGNILGYRYCFKAHQRPSELGIGGSEISKLELWKDDELLVNYDRGWDLEPDTADLRNIINAIFRDNGYRLVI